MKKPADFSTFLKYVILILLIFQVAILPLVVRLRLIPLNAEVIRVWNSGENWDFFAYYKSLGLVFSTFVMSSLILLYWILKRKVRMTRVDLLAFLYLLFVLLSALLSKYKFTALFGFPSRYEGLYAQAAYILIFLIASRLLRNERNRNIFLIMLFISSFIVGLIAILQFFGLDFFQTNIGQRLTLSGQYQDLREVIQYQIGHLAGIGNQAYSTLGNPNTLGIYMSLVFPLAFFLAVLSKNVKKKFVLAILSLIMFTSLIASLSRGSILGVVGSLIVSSIIFRKKLLPLRKTILIILLVSLIIATAMDGAMDGIVSTRLTTMLNRSEIHPEDQVIDKIKEFDLKGNRLKLSTTKTQLDIILNMGEVLFYGENEEELTLEQLSEKEFGLLDPRYKDYRVSVIDNTLRIQKGKSFLYFGIVNDEFRFLDHRGNVVELSQIETSGFKGIERWGSGRGYIWSRSLPLLEDKLLVGSGSDTFAMEFPQHDYLGKLKFMYDAYLIIDKPHNLYLQTAVNTGVVSLLILITFFGYFLVGTLLNRKSINVTNSVGNIQVAVFTSILSYLLSGLFTDSTVAVSPVFWALLGLGFSCFQREKSNLILNCYRKIS